MELVDISSLVPSSSIPANNAFKALVTLLWPFSSATGQCALLLADRDFRKRYHKGQVRVRFAGPSARAIGASKIGIGDEVELGLEGATWVTEVEGVLVKVPGKSLEGELVFNGRLSLVVRREGQEDRSVRVDEPVSESGSADLANVPSTPVAPPSRASGCGMDDFGVAVYSSPAFMSRLRRLEASNGKPARTTASGEDNLDDEAARKRRRTSYKNVTEWRYDTREPSPDKQAAQPQAVESTGEKEQEDAEMAEVQEGSTEEATMLNAASKDQESTLVEEDSIMQDTASSNKERHSQGAQSPTVGERGSFDQEKGLDQASRHPSATEQIGEHAAQIQPSQLSEQSKDEETIVSGQDQQEECSAKSPRVETEIRGEQSIENLAHESAQEPVQEPAQENVQEPSQGLNPAVDQEIAEEGEPAPDTLALEDDQDVASPTPMPKHPSMAPPPLPPLQMPTTPRHFSMERDNAMATPVNGEGPLTPRLEPVDNHNLPLPSPFPTSAKRLVAPSPVKAAEQSEVESTSVKFDFANAIESGKSDVSVSEHDNAANPVEGEDEAFNSPERTREESPSAPDHDDTRGIEVVEVDGSDDDMDGLERIRGVPGSTASPIPQFDGSGPDNISVAEVEESDDAASHRSSSEEPMVSQIADVDEGGPAEEETYCPPAESKRVVPDTYDDMELVRSSPPRPVEDSQSPKSQAASREDVEMGLGGPPNDESALSEDDYNEDMLASLQASDESEQGGTPDLGFLDDHHDIDEQDLAALRAYDDESTTSDEMAHESDLEGSENSLINASDDDTGDGEDEDEQEEEQEDENEEDRSSFDDPESAELPDTWGQEDFEPSHYVSDVESFASQILASAAVERSKLLSVRDETNYSKPAKDMIALPAPIEVEENNLTDEESAWKARAEALREIENDQSAVPAHVSRKAPSPVHHEDEPTADAPLPSSRTKVAIVELSDSEDSEDDEQSKEAKYTGSSDGEDDGSMDEADRLKEGSDRQSTEKSGEDSLEDLAGESQDSSDNDSDNVQEEDLIMGMDDESDGNHKDSPEDSEKQFSVKQKDESQEKADEETERARDDHLQEEIQGKDDEVDGTGEILHERLKRPQEQIAERGTNADLNPETNEYPNEALGEDMDDKMADNLNNLEETEEKTNGHINNTPSSHTDQALGTLSDVLTSGAPNPVDVLSKQRSVSREGDASQHSVPSELPDNEHDNDLPVNSPPNVGTEDHMSPAQSFIDGAQTDAEPSDFANKDGSIHDGSAAQPPSNYDPVDQSLESDSHLPELHEANYNTEVGPQTLDLPQRPAGSDTDAPVLVPASTSALEDADYAQQLTSSSFMTLSSSPPAPPAPPRPSQRTGSIEEIDLSQVEPDYWAYSQPTRTTQRTEPVPDSVGSPATPLFRGSSRQPSRAPSPLKEQSEVSSDEDTIQVHARAPVFSQDLGFSQLYAHHIHPTNMEVEDLLPKVQESLEPPSIEEDDEVTVDDELLADYVQNSPGPERDQNMLDATSLEGVLISAPEISPEEKQLEDSATSDASDMQVEDNEQEPQTDDVTAGRVIVPSQQSGSPSKANAVGEIKDDFPISRQSEDASNPNSVETQKHVSLPQQTHDFEVASPLQQLHIVAQPQAESNINEANVRISLSPKASSEQKVALKVSSEDNKPLPEREPDIALSLNQKAREQSKRPLLLEQNLLTTPTSRRETAPRTSTGGRMNAVPAIISAWFTPRRSSGALTPSRPQEQSRKQTPTKVAPTPPAKLQSQSSRKRSISPPPITRLAFQGISTSLSYFYPLTAVGKFLNQPSTVDVLAVSADASTSPEQAKGGRKDFYTILHIMDPSLQEYNESRQETTGKERPGDDMRVECFRPWKASLPTTDPGDVVLLRNFVVKSQKHRTYLMTGETSSWCVWRFSAASASREEGGTEDTSKPVWARNRGVGNVKEDVKGPPVEIGHEEREKATELRRWWEELKASQDDMAKKATMDDEDQETAT